MPEIFAEPGRLLLILAALGLAGYVARGSIRRRDEWRALGQSGWLPPDGAWPWWCAGLGLILALAAPRWGRVAGSELPPGHDVVLVVDVSRSMGAEDAVPDRLGLARNAARSLIDQLRREPGDRAALVAFAGRAVARCPLTDNLDAVADSLGELRAGSIEPGGTDLGAGLTTALDSFDAAEHAEGRSIVIFSDGEDHADSWPSVVGRLVEAEVVVHVVAVGDPDRDHPVPPAAAGPASASAASPAMTRRSDAALTQLAHATGGAVVPLGVAVGDLGALYRDRIAPTARGRRPPPRFSERAERYPIFLSAALAAGLLGTWPPSRRFRSRSGWGGRGSRSWGRFCLIVAIAVCLVIASLAATPATPRTRAEAATARGVRASREGRFADALAAFEEAIAARPSNPIGPYNAGAALFALERYPEAASRYEEARVLARRGLAVKVAYALGNCSAMLGDFAAAVRHYDACLVAADPDPASVEIRRDAAINRAFALERIEPPPDDPRTGPGSGDAGADDRSSPRPRRPQSTPRSDRPPPGGAPDDPNDPAAAGDPGSGGDRGAGGAGGGGAAAPEANSPAGRLDAALRRIRAAKEKRPSEPTTPPPPGPRGSAKDW